LRRVGGHFRILHVESGADIGGFECEIVELVPDERIVFRWGFVGPERTAGQVFDSVLTITLHAAPGGANGFTAPLVCERLPVVLMVLVAAMVPAPGEAAGDWFTNTGYQPAKLDRVEQSEVTRGEDAETIAAFFHDLPQDLATEALKRMRYQSETPGKEPWPLQAWPDVPTRFLLCRGDRFFPADFMRRVVKERLGITPDEIDGGHCVALSRPKELAARLDSYIATVQKPFSNTRSKSRDT
jgi:pimeloyl-ACP methyl ester carboxylesterase